YTDPSRSTATPRILRSRASVPFPLSPGRALPPPARIVTTPSEETLRSCLPHSSPTSRLPLWSTAMPHGAPPVTAVAGLPSTDSNPIRPEPATVAMYPDGEIRRTRYD